MHNYLDIYLSNLNATCLRCICVGLTNCDVLRGCENEYCGKSTKPINQTPILKNISSLGPFYISRIYWADAGKVVFPDDNPNRENAYSDCASDYPCASKIITNYMIKYAKDCNEDGVIDCSDYDVIHLNGFANCDKKLETLSHGRDFLSRYNQCKLY